MWDTTWDTWDKIGSSIRKKGLIYRAVSRLCYVFFIFIILSSIIQSSNKNSLLHYEISGEDALESLYCEQYNYLALIIHTANSIFYRKLSKPKDLSRCGDAGSVGGVQGKRDGVGRC